MTSHRTLVERAVLDIGATIRQLRAAQKSKKGAPAYSVYINRPAGRVLAAVAYELGLSPNAVTLVSAFFTFAGILTIALISPSWLSGVVVAALLCLGYALDSADGQLARLRGGGSLLGEWLDHVVDSAKVVSVHVAVVVAALRFDIGPSWWVLGPLLFAVVAVVSFFAPLLNDLLARTVTPAAPADSAGTSLLRALAKLPTDYGVLCLTFVLLGSDSAFVLAYSVELIASFAYLMLALPSWYRRMARLDAR